MATMMSSYPSYVYNQQPYHFPTAYSQQPVQNNYYAPQQQQQQQTTSSQYVDSSASLMRPRRQPRIYREVIVLPTPEPIYRQVVRRLPTPDRETIQRTVIQKANGDVIVRQQQPKTRSHSRSEHKGYSRSSRSRQVHTD